MPAKYCVINNVFLYLDLITAESSDFTRGRIHDLPREHRQRSSYAKYHHTRKDFKKEPMTGLRVMIVTQMRSGSTITGELFNINDDFAYFFEPLFPVRRQIKFVNTSSVIYKNVKVPLAKLLRCNFRNLPHQWWNATSIGSMKTRCEKRRFLHDSPLCKHPKPTGAFLPPSFGVMLEEMCRRKKHLALKTIRVEDLNFLKDVVEDATELNIKIIHLVRDPRAVYYSRLKIPRNTYTPDVSITCPRLERNVRTGLSRPQWLRDKYLLVRFEDLANAPVAVAEKIYNFLNITMPDPVYKWIQHNTQGSTEDDVYSVSKNSRTTAVKWRQALSLKQVLYVQSYCETAMGLLGYRTVATEESLRNMTSNVTELWPS